MHIRQSSVLLALVGLFAGALAACVPPAPPGAPAVPANCAPSGAYGTSVTCTFSYNGTDGTDGSAQTFVVPAGIGVVTIDAWGAQGGGGGGLGGHGRGVFAETSGSLLSVLVGGQGGFNGGGAGPPSGGGGSDVRAGGTVVANRIIAAGGGGGEGRFFEFSAGLDVDIPLDGGVGGGLAGAPGTCSFAATPPVSFPLCGAGGVSPGGTSPGGGAPAPGPSSAACFNNDGTVTDATGGSLGAGGNGATASCPPPYDASAAGAGGGGGWFGGGGGAAVARFALPHESSTGGGGGGSSYVAPPGTSLVNESGVRAGNGLVTITYSRVPATAAACRSGGWRNLVDQVGHAFANEGACIAWAEKR